jgi:hypothetical protein
VCVCVCVCVYGEIYLVTAPGSRSFVYVKG